MSVMALPPLSDLDAELEQLRRDVDEMRVAARELPELCPEERRELKRKILDFLDQRVLPHADAEEEVLYPALEARTESPAVEHLKEDDDQLLGLVAELRELNVYDGLAFAELLYDLASLLDLHFDKEEDLYLPLLRLDPDEGYRVLSSMDAIERPGWRGYVGGR